MTTSTRVAMIATITCAILGFVAASTPGFASEVDVTPKIPAVDADILPLVPATVPTDSALMLGQALDTPIPSSPPAIPSSAAAARYTTLAAAVAAHSTSDDMDRDLACLAGAIYFESKGEPLSGQLAVAEVVINRSKSGRFPGNICAVVTQRGQFSFVRGGRIPAISNNANYRTATAVARVAMADAWDSPAAKAMFFHARHVTPGWRRAKVAMIGNHIFYR